MKSNWTLSLIGIGLFSVGAVWPRASDHCGLERDCMVNPDRSAQLVSAADRSSPNSNSSDPTNDELASFPEFTAINEPVRFDPNVVPTQGIEQAAIRQQSTGTYDNSHEMSQPSTGSGASDPCESSAAQLPDKYMFGVDQNSVRGGDREPTWNDQQRIPWETFAYGEYLGPYRTPHVAELRLRIKDQVDFVYTLTREHLSQPYQIYAGDVLQVFSGADATLNQKDVVVLSDGTISLPLIGQTRAAGKTLGQLNEELDARYAKFVKHSAIIVQVTKGDTPANDLINSVVARFGQSGQSRQAEVTADGTIQLPLIGPVPALGLTLGELAREVNARYASQIRGLSLTPVLINQAPRSVYVLGQVSKPGRIDIQGPTSVMQAISMAEGWTPGSNLRQIIVFRRDQNWKLMATKIDLQGALLGKRPHPADEIWLRDSDIVLIPKTPVLRASEAVDLYFTRTLYSIFPQQGVVFNFDGFRTF